MGSAKGNGTSSSRNWKNSSIGLDRHRSGKPALLGNCSKPSCFRPPSQSSPTARNGLRRQIASFDLLFRNADPQQLATLAERLRFASTDDWAERLRACVSAFAQLELYLNSHAEEWKRSHMHEALKGDWVWNPNVGFGLVEEVTSSDRARVDVRRKADTLNVMLSYYINLRERAENDALLAGLLDACRDVTAVASRAGISPNTVSFKD